MEHCGAVDKLFVCLFLMGKCAGVLQIFAQCARYCIALALQTDLEVALGRLEAAGGLDLRYGIFLHI